MNAREAIRLGRARGAIRSWLTALRIARREVRRAKGRSALVVLLIGLPVLGVTVAAVSYDMFTLTAAERMDRIIGAAEAELRWYHHSPVFQRDVSGQWYDGGDQYEETEDTGEPGATGDGDADADADAEELDGYARDRTAAEVTAVLPPGSRVMPRWQGMLRLPTATGTGDLIWHGLDLADPLTRGLVRVVDGRAPAGPGEVAVTARAADRLAVVVGDRLEVPELGDPVVVGMVEFPGLPGSVGNQDETPGLRAQALLFHPDGMPAERWPVRWLVDTPQPILWEQVQELNEHGIVVHSRAVALDPPAGLADFSTRPVADVPRLGVGVLIAGLAALEIVLLAGPAFAVGARRRQRDLALVAAGGGTPAHLRRIVLADGVVLGTVATGLGLLLGIGLTFAARPLLETWLVGTRAGDYRVFPAALAGIVVFAVGTAVLAALVPAFTAARQPVVDGLAGRRGATRSRRRWLVLGLAMVAVGTAVTGGGAWLTSEHAILAGLIAGQLGLALCTPALVGLVARVGPRLRLAPRIALRDTARNRAAAAPAIAAVMAAVAGAVTLGVVLNSIESREYHFPGAYAPGTAVVNWGSWWDPASPATPAAVERAARSTLPVTAVYRQWEYEEWLGPGNVSVLQVLVPEDQLCPYWDRAWDLSRAEQRLAAADPRCDGSNPRPFDMTVFDDGTALAALTGAEPAELAAATRVLRNGGAVVTDARYLTGGTGSQVTLGDVEYHDDDGGVTLHYQDAITVPGYLLTTGTERSGAIVSLAVAREAGLDPEPGAVLFTTERMPTQAEQDAFEAALVELDAWGYVEPGSITPDPSPLLVLLALIAGVVALGAAGIATGLAAADRRGDLSTLGAVGASPRVRRSLSLSQSGVVAGLGTALGLLAGLGAAVAVLVGLNQQYDQIWPTDPPIPIAVPWLVLGGLLAVPVVAMLGAGLLTRSRLPIERRLA